MAEPTDWWYYFEKTEQGKVASCKYCTWTILKFSYLKFLFEICNAFN